MVQRQVYVIDGHGEEKILQIIEIKILQIFDVIVRFVQPGRAADVYRYQTRPIRKGKAGKLDGMTVVSWTAGRLTITR